MTVTAEIIRGAVFGAAIGDAVGVPYEFTSRDHMSRRPATDMVGNGTYHLPAGTWSDDTTMILCTLDKLDQSLDYDAIMMAFLSWVDDGNYTPHGKCFDIGNTTRSALLNYARGCKAEESGLDDAYSNGNGSLMRIIPAALYADAHGLSTEKAVLLSHKLSSLTHAHPRSKTGCGIFTCIALALLRKADKGSVCDGMQTAAAFYSRKEYGAEIKKEEYHEYLLVSYYMADNRLYTQPEMNDDADVMELSADIGNYFFMTEKTYSDLTNETLGLSEGEIVVCSIYNPNGLKDITGTLTIHGNDYRIKNNIYHYPISASYLASMFSCYGVVVPDENTLGEIYAGQKKALGQHASEYTRRIAVTFADLGKAETAGDGMDKDIIASLRQLAGDATLHYNLDTRWNAKEAMLGMFGTLLFLGLLLGAVFLFATALIIYYKQISEGFEDRTRFQIMEKVGMSRQEVKKTIGRQVLLVFFLPLAVAGVHMAAVFPILTRMMKILLFFSIKLFVICTLITFSVFALVYVLIYLCTSKTYYSIVR